MDTTGEGEYKPFPRPCLNSRYPCATPPSAPSSCAVWAATVVLVVSVICAPFHENAPAAFGRSKADILKFFDG